MRGIVIAATAALSACATAPDLPAPAPAAPLAAVADSPIEAPAGTYALDPAHTRVIWRVTHLGLSGYIGRFNTVSGALTLDPAQPTASALRIEIAADSVDTGHADKAFDAKIARDVLGAEAHPKIAFVSTRLTRTGPQTGVMTGDLTLNGVTRPVDLEVTLNDVRFVALLGKTAAGFSARGAFKRSEFGADDWAQFVGDEVQLTIEAEFLKAS